MNFVLFLVVAFLSLLIGVCGFAQIVGSLQNVKMRGMGLTLFTVVLWCLIFFAEWALVMNFLPDYKFPYYVVTGISLLVILCSGKIR